eukprot:TRINITY_DN1871_c0_g1_i1.p1 TRINITY_DN1871_c0_g1~~TRINITY_DN1871_c0_g1_i1.p1  ORF type:complete len:131 (+),score=12.46 TRINITY_DN1871_c0_g1_i1:23-394(+)
MTTFREFHCDDLLRFANINLDMFTETYNFGFYFMYMAKWPEYITLAESPAGRPMGYSRVHHAQPLRAHTLRTQFGARPRVRARAGTGTLPPSRWRASTAASASRSSSWAFSRRCRRIRTTATL